MSSFAEFHMELLQVKFYTPKEVTAKWTHRPASDGQDKADSTLVSEEGVSEEGVSGEGVKQSTRSFLALLA